MMISPITYVKEHENDTYEQLIKERNSLVRQIKNLEKIVFDKEKQDESWHICPGPDVRYQMYLEYLAELCKFMQEKYNTEYIWGEVE